MTSTSGIINDNISTHITMRISIFLFDAIYVFFFKQKTAYELRISDWSSDVCSSDLAAAQRLLQVTMREPTAMTTRAFTNPPSIMTSKIGRASCRARVCQYV